MPFPDRQTQQSRRWNPGKLTQGQRIYSEANTPSIINKPVLLFLPRNHGTQQTETRPAAWDLLLLVGKLTKKRTYLWHWSEWILWTHQRRCWRTQSGRCRTFLIVFHFSLLFSTSEFFAWLLLLRLFVETWMSDQISRILCVWAFWTAGVLKRRRRDQSCSHHESDAAN